MTRHTRPSCSCLRGGAPAAPRTHSLRRRTGLIPTRATEQDVSPCARQFAPATFWCATARSREPACAHQAKDTRDVHAAGRTSLRLARAASRIKVSWMTHGDGSRRLGIPSPFSAPNAAASNISSKVPSRRAALLNNHRSGRREPLTSPRSSPWQTMSCDDRCPPNSLSSTTNICG